ncbi:hypothetical protein, partial [Endozoicomonas acroporae]|uniref:hypothetical protein n=1 Tax=Endozoicomonas acroporae TaxID=1701104 RepID=UPI003D79F768
MANLSNAKAAINIINGKASSVSIAKAAENYSEGNDLDAAADLYGALNSMSQLAGKGLPAAQAIQASIVAEKLKGEIDQGYVSDNTIQDILGIGLASLGAAALAAGAGAAALVATVAGVALGAYSLVRPEGGRHIFDSLTTAYDEAYASGPFQRFLGLFDSNTDTPTFNEAESLTSPIILDLDGDGVETLNKSEGVYFDHDGNLLAEKT